jgi:hypothetical protein
MRGKRVKILRRIAVKAYLIKANKEWKDIPFKRVFKQIKRGWSNGSLRRRAGTRKNHVDR